MHKFVTETIQYPDTYSATIRLDNNDIYQLRVATDSVGNVWVWVDYCPSKGKWTKMLELLNGIKRST